ncbi:hypothetical protein L1049_004969 [Liquidambar formosana]|uniref:Uncharacterized protein n=1 Tax=Liquidambar formosana TaxID=63359 RepID=A0AAP0RP27_LIQFO
MQERDNQLQPLGICHRLFNFIMNSLVARGIKRVTLGRPASHGGSTKPDGEESLLSPTGQRKSVEKSSSEIVVEFKHTNGLEYWTPIDKTEIPLVQGIGDSSGTSLSQAKEKSVTQVQAKGSQEVELVSTSVVSAKGPKKTVTIKDGAEEMEKYKKKGKNIATERVAVALEREVERKNPPKHYRPVLLSVSSNVNEKSTEFIRRTKEAMMERELMQSRSISMDRSQYGS